MASVTTPVPTSTLFNNNRTAIQDKIGTKVTSILQSEDTFMRDIPITSAGVKQEAVGREYTINMLYTEQAITGNFEPSHGVGRSDFTMYGEGLTAESTKFQRYAKPTKTIPSPFGGMLPKPFRFSVPLRGYLGNFPMSLTMMDSDLNDANVFKMVNDLFDNVSRGVSTQIFNAFWLEDHKLAALGPSTGSGAYAIGAGSTVNNRTITFYPSNRAIRRFHVGMQVDLWTGAVTGATRVNQSTAASSTVITEANRIRVYVQDVIPHLNKVVLTAPTEASVDGTTTAATFTTWCTTVTLGESAYVTYANIWADTTNDFKGLFGVHHYLKTSGNLLGDEAVTGITDGSTSILGGALSVDDHPTFKSVQFNVNQVLTEHLLNTYLDTFFDDADMWGADLDTVVTTTGVMRAYQKNHEAKAILDRTGVQSTLQYEGNSGDWVHQYKPGKRITMKMNSVIEKGRVYGLKVRDNWRIAIPPYQRSNNSRVQTGKIPVDFFAGRLMNNGGGSHMPYFLTDSGTNPVEVKITEWMQFPFRTMLQFVCDKQPRALYLTGCTEERTFADA